MRLLHVSAEEGERFKKAADSDDWEPMDEEDAWPKLNWFKKHGPGYFLVFCCGEAKVPEGLVVDGSHAPEDLPNQVNRFAELEGWAIFEVNTERGWEIQRDDAQGLFKDDDEAIEHAKNLAAEGSKLHALALQFCS